LGQKEAVAGFAGLANSANFAKCLEDLFGDYDIFLYFCRKMKQIGQMTFDQL